MVVREPVDGRARLLLHARPDEGGGVLLGAGGFALVLGTIMMIAAATSDGPAGGLFATSALMLASSIAMFVGLAVGVAAERRYCIEITPSGASAILDIGVAEWRMLPSGLRAETLPVLHGLYEAVRVAGLAPDDSSLTAPASERYAILRDVRQANERIDALAASHGDDSDLAEARRTLDMLRAGLAAVERREVTS